MKLGDRIKFFRERKNLNQKELAEVTGLTQATISRVEAGQVNQLRSDALRNLAIALDVSIDSLLDLSDSEESKINSLFEFVIRDPDFRYGTRLIGELDVDAKRFIIELYEKATGRTLLS